MRVIALLLLIGCGDVKNSVADAGDARVDAPDPLRGLVAWYRMEALTDMTMSDETGHHPGSCDNRMTCPAVTSTGRFGNAYSFAGAAGMEDLVRVPSSDELKTTAGFTVTTWFNFDQDAVGCFVNKIYTPPGVSNANSWQACLGDGMLSFFSTSPPLRYPAVLVAGQWYHVALTWDGDAQALYFQGQLRAQQSRITLPFDDGPITIGGDLDNALPTAPFHGQIDDVRIYNRALSADDLRSLQTP